MKGVKMNAKSSKMVLSSVLILVAIGLLFPIYNAPIWWVSLEAPNYPEESFPDGVRIYFHLNGVFNGCEKMDKVEIIEDEALDCVHEMDTINHYVGMYPIASGGPVELFFSIFLLALVGVMLVAFICVNPKIRTGIMVVGFGALAVWMGLAWLGDGGLNYHSGDYLNARITVAGEDADDLEATTSSSAADDQVATLKAALGEGGVKLAEGVSALDALKAAQAGEKVAVVEVDDDESVEVAATTPEQDTFADLNDKEKSIAFFKDSFEHYQTKYPETAEEWTGSGSQFVPWHYQKSLGKYFRDMDVLRPMTAKIATAGNVVFYGVLAIMVFLIVMARKPSGPFNWMMILIPMGLPLYFVVEYVTWLWWYGHNMNSMGAFTLKPFTPTAFGQGKVAQFTTNSYPEYGFWLIVVFTVLLGVAAYLRKQEQESVKEDK
jgi:hypothetical protein